MASHPKPSPRIRDRDLFRIMHASPEKECCLCEGIERLEIHHVLPKAQAGDDVRSNLVWLCSVCHHYVTLNYPEARKSLGQYLVEERRDVLQYVSERLGDGIGKDWLERRLFVDPGC